jgi:hypothetical protein
MCSSLFTTKAAKVTLLLGIAFLSKVSVPDIGPT